MDSVQQARAAAAARPDNDEVQAGLGNLLTELGRLDEARAVLRRAVRLAPGQAGHYGRLAKVVKFAAGDPELVRAEKLAREAASLPEPDRIELGFALGKAYADLGRDAEAWAAYAEANALMRGRIAYDEAAALGLVARIADAFTARLLANPPGDPVPGPVFIVGMPRSGSTLAERMLAGHPAIRALGEANDFAAARALALGDRARVAFPDGVAALEAESLRRLGQVYRERVDCGPGRLALNKMLGNFAYLGFIHLAMPGARFIHTVRDPLDGCLSCYFELFAEGHPYCYDLGELGRFRQAHDRLMAHWRAVLPKEVLLDVCYEQLVADPEAEGRRMLAHLGLDWDPACLDFSGREGAVRTASVAQVRQPLYRTSVGRWRRWEAWLGPLKEALGDWIPSPAARGEGE
jgi:tetratricopeptide (TPR) repeat protein